MKTAHEHVTMDGTELRLLERYAPGRARSAGERPLGPHARANEPTVAARSAGAKLSAAVLASPADERVPITNAATAGYAAPTEHPIWRQPPLDGEVRDRYIKMAGADQFGGN
jgi:hypothetical protein